MMTSDPYTNKPKAQSDANAWHELSFQISIDEPVDWDQFDLRKWAQNVAKYTALVMAKTTMDQAKIDEAEVIKTLIMNLKVSRVTLVTDDTLHSLIDEFGDE